MRKTVIGIILGGILLFIGYRGGALLHAQISAKYGRLAVTITTRGTQPGAPSREMFVSEAYRSDGSLAKTAMKPNDKSAPLVEVIDVAAKRNYVKDSLIRQYDETPLTQDTFNAHVRPPTTCEAAAPPSSTCFPIGGEKLLGYSVQKAIVQLPSKGGRTLELYLAPELGFLPLKRIYREQNGTVLSEVLAVSIVRGEPDPALFALPSDYTRAQSSSALLIAGQKARGLEEGFTADTAVKFDDVMQLKRQAAQSKVVK